MRLLAIFFGATTALSGCAVAPEAFTGPGGKQAYTMECSGSGRTIAQCYKKAGELCPAGYSLISQTSTPYGVPTQQGTLILSTDQMAIECK